LGCIEEKKIEDEKGNYIEEIRSMQDKSLKVIPKIKPPEVIVNKMRISKKAGDNEHLKIERPELKILCKSEIIPC